MTYFFETYGCQMNQAESSSVARLLDERGWAESPDPDGADLRAGPLRARLEFSSAARSPGDIRRQLVELAGEARKRHAASPPA